MKISRPMRPKVAVLTCYRCFLRARIYPFRADAGRERNPDAPQEGAFIPAMRPEKSTQKGTLQQGSVVLKFSVAALLHALQRCCQPFEMLERSVWFGAHGARKFKFFTVFPSGQELRVRSFCLYIFRPIMVAAQRELSRVWRSAKETCL